MSVPQCSNGPASVLQRVPATTPSSILQLTRHSQSMRRISHSDHPAFDSPGDHCSSKGQAQDGANTKVAERWPGLIGIAGRQHRQQGNRSLVPPQRVGTVGHDCKAGYSEWC